MTENYDWAGFDQALCRLGPQLLVGIGEDVRQIIAMVAEQEDAFWSDGLEDLLAQHAVDGDIRAGVLATSELWRENVLTALSDNFGIDLDWAEVGIDAESPLVAELVAAATPDDRG